MIKLNETDGANINVLGEDELTQVVGGNCHRRRGGYGHCGGYDKYESYDSYEGSDDSSSSDSSSDNVQITNVNVTVNIAQVQG